MVSSGTVTSDLSTFNSNISNYQNSIGDLSSQWKGSSYENLVAKANEFVSEYKAAIDKQMTSFASACSLYAEYVQTKSALASARAAYAQAEAEKDYGSMNQYAALISQYESKLQSLKSQIESALAGASSPSLAASSTTGQSITASTLSYSVTGVVAEAPRKALEYALSMADDNSHGYSQEARRRWGTPDYDCSSLVITCWENAGVPVREAGAGYTGNMRKAFLSTGLFEWIPGNPSVEDLQPGDVLLNENSHTELYLGDGKMVGARHGDADGVPGDSSGNEISVTDLAREWQGILRYTGGNTTTQV